MAINKNKINDNALKCIQKGQIKKAIKEYEKILAEDPSDVRTLLKKGDLLVRAGDKSQAVDTYLMVANAYSQQGFYLKAVAVFKQILKIDESRIDVNLRLAEEYQNLGVVGDAMSHLQVVAAYYEQQGQAHESLDILRRMVELEPENIASRIKLAELYSRENMVAEAVSEFSQAANDLKEANRVEDFVKVAERLVYHDQSNISLIKELSNIYLQRGDTKRSLGKLQICFKADPRDLDTLSMLAMAFHELKQLSKTVSVYKEMAKIYEEKGSDQEVEQVYRRILEIAPDDPEACEALGVQAADGTVDEEDDWADMPDEPAYIEEVDEADVYEEEDEPSSPQMTQPAAARAGDGEMEEIDPEPDEVEMTLEAQSPVAEVSQDPDRELISRLLTETDVYIKYGLNNKAFEHLNRVFEVDPANIEAHTKLKDLYLNANQMEHVVQELLTLTHLNMRIGRNALAQQHLQELLGVEPDHPDGLVLAGQMGMEVAGPVDDQSGNAAAAFDELDEVSIDLSDESVELSVDEVSFDDVPAVDNYEDPSVSPSDRDDMYAQDEETNLMDSLTLDDALKATGDAMEVLDDYDDPSSETVDLDASEVGALLDSGNNFLEPEIEGVEEVSFDEVSSPTVQEVGAEDFELAGDPPIREMPEPEEPEVPLDPLALDPLAPVGQEEPGIEDPVFEDPVADDELLIDDEPEIIREDEEVEAEVVSEDLSPEPVPEKPIEFVDDGDIEDLSVADEEAEIEASESESVADELEDSSLSDLEDGLEEVDFFLQQNLLEEAKDTLEGLKEEYPDHPDVLANIERIEKLEKGDDSVDQVSADELAEPFDLAAELEREGDIGGDFGAAPLDDEFQYSVDDVFSAFKKGVDQVVDEEDSATHFDLGIAYKEMGLVDDAIREFQVSSQDPSRRANCLTMVGLIHGEQGRQPEAIDSFKDALHSKGITEQEQTGLFFELALAYEALADKNEMLLYLKKVYKRDPKFRDVAARLKKLIKAASEKGDPKPPKDSNKEKISYM